MLNVKDFKAEAIDELIAQTTLWNQNVTVILCIDLDEDEEEEKHYLAKTQEFLEKNISLVTKKIEFLPNYLSPKLTFWKNY